jgi:hypothetical protein
VHMCMCLCVCVFEIRLSSHKLEKCNAHVALFCCLDTGGILEINSQRDLFS